MNKNFFFIPIVALMVGLPAIQKDSVAVAQTTNAQQTTSRNDALVFNKKIHDFGKFNPNGVPMKCTFEFKNTSGKPVMINNVLSSCGCTNPKWPKKPIMNGETGVIEVTFLNDQGPQPFDKSLTVYTSLTPKPIMLRITGVPITTQKTAKQQYPISLGPLGVRNNTFKMGQLEQGDSDTKSVRIANLSNKPVKISFSNVSTGLTLTAIPESIPADGIGDIEYTINTSAKENWGSTIYSANVLCNGVKASTPILVDCMIIDNFNKLTKEEINNGPMIIAKNSSVNFGRKSKGEPITATFNLRNSGYRDLKIYKADTNGGKYTLDYPKVVKAGDEFTVIANINTANLKGEQVFTATLITNSPSRPLVNIFVTGTII